MVNILQQPLVHVAIPRLEQTEPEDTHVSTKTEPEDQACTSLRIFWFQGYEDLAVSKPNLSIHTGVHQPNVKFYILIGPEYISHFKYIYIRNIEVEFEDIWKYLIWLLFRPDRETEVVGILVVAELTFDGIHIWYEEERGYRNPCGSRAYHTDFNNLV